VSDNLVKVYYKTFWKTFLHNLEEDILNNVFRLHESDAVHFYLFDKGDSEQFVKDVENLFTIFKGVCSNPELYGQCLDEACRLLRLEDTGKNRFTRQTVLEYLRNESISEDERKVFLQEFDVFKLTVKQCVQILTKQTKDES
jgi:hypothetical protein